MTTLAGLGRADRRRVEDRLVELRELEKEMRRPGLLPGSAEPVPLHRAGQGNASKETAR